MNRFRRGFSSPLFQAGGKSEHDIAVEAMAGVIEEGMTAGWDARAIALYALQAAEHTVAHAEAQHQHKQRLPKPPRDHFELLDLRRGRAEQLTAQIIHEIGEFLCEHGENRGHRDAAGRLFTQLFECGAELITDADREQNGLPRRNDSGLTRDELHVLENRRLTMLLSPSAVIVPAKS